MAPLITLAAIPAAVFVASFCAGYFGPNDEEAVPQGNSRKATR